MKILVACELPEASLEQLRTLTPRVVYLPAADTRKLDEQLSGVGVLVVGSLRVSPDMLARADALQMIVHAGRGPGEIAVEDASTQGIFVTHCPDTHAAAIAELTMGFVLALDRNIVDSTITLRSGRWNRGQAAAARGLAGCTLGILGYGAVGRLVARRARAFDMSLLAWSAELRPDVQPEPGIEFCNWPRELARRSDVVTIHTGADDPEHIVDQQFLQNMRPSAALVHVGHPAAIDIPAVLEAIEQRGLRVAIDAFGTEPPADTERFRCSLCESQRVIATPHVAPLTEQARQATAEEVVRVIKAFVVSGEVLNSINLCERSPATWQLVLRVKDQVGVMAAVLEAVRADGINAEEINSRVFTGAKAAWCTIALDERPSTEALDSIRALDDVLHLELRAVV